MKLEVDGAPSIENPSAEDIVAALSNLSAKQSDFVILGHDQLTYLQADGSRDDGFSLEYQKGSLAEHYRCIGELSFPAVVKIFQFYAKGQDRWHGLCKWENQLLNQSHESRDTRQKITIYFENDFFTYLLLSISAVAFFAIFMASGKTTNHRIWGSVAVVCFAVFCAAITTQIVIQGEYGGVESFVIIRRSDSPIQFWSAVITGYGFAVTLFIGMVLYNLGVIDVK